MSAQNPFQIPSCFKLEIEQRRRERFKKTVVTAVVVSVAVVVGLLIEGCVSERAEVGPTQPSAQTASVQTSETWPAAQVQAKQAQVVSQKNLTVQPCPVATVPPATPVATPHAAGAANSIYLVRAGDTLSRIAHAHKTTVKAIKLANNLGTDRIAIGQQLKIPSA